MKRVLLVAVLALGGFAAWRWQTQRRRDSALWAEATDRV
jgi:MYXO-CTERM domain-containing protein